SSATSCGAPSARSTQPPASAASASARPATSSGSSVWWRPRRCAVTSRSGRTASPPVLADRRAGGVLVGEHLHPGKLVVAPRPDGGERRRIHVQTAVSPGTADSHDHHHVVVEVVTGEHVDPELLEGLEPGRPEPAHALPPVVWALIGQHVEHHPFDLVGKVRQRLVEPALVEEPVEVENPFDPLLRHEVASACPSGRSPAGRRPCRSAGGGRSSARGRRPSPATAPSTPRCGEWRT